jgi:hypothetical protein
MARSKKLKGQMMHKVMVAAIAGMMMVSSNGATGAVTNLQERGRSASVEHAKEFLMAQRRSCQAASTCEDAVEMWCGGYSGADRDKDGIPCENVCRSKSQVDAIKQRIGC